MIVFCYYLLKVTLCSSLLYGYYFVALRNKAFHQWNRFYLLFVIAFSLIFPLVKINVDAEPVSRSGAVRIIQLVSQKDQHTTAAVKQYEHERFVAANSMYLSYLLVSVILSLAFMKSILNMIGLIRKATTHKFDKVKIITTSVNGTPFSFFNYIFWDDEIDRYEEPGKHIFNHELVHVKEKHTFDKLAIQLVLICCWINPFFWLIKKEISVIHEFLADKRSVGNNKMIFASMILKSSPFNHEPALSSHFLTSSLKRRWLMIKPHKRNKVSYLSRIISFFIFSGIFLFASVAFRNKVIVGKPYSSPVLIAGDIPGKKLIDVPNQDDNAADLLRNPIVQSHEILVDTTNQAVEPDLTIYNYIEGSNIIAEDLPHINDPIPTGFTSRPPNTQAYLNILEKRKPVYPELTSARMIFYPSKLYQEIAFGADTDEKWFMAAEIYNSEKQMVRKVRLTRQLANDKYPIVKLSFGGLKKARYLINVTSSDNRYRQSFIVVKDYDD